MIPEKALQIVLDHLEASGITYMISGSFASNVHGVPRVTYDADVIVEAELLTLLRFVGGLGSDFYADPEAAKTAFAGNRMFNIIHMPTGFKVDLILRKARSFSEQEFQRRQQVDLLGRTCWFTSPEDIILFIFTTLSAQTPCRNAQLGAGSVTMEVAGLCEVMDWVMGFGRHAEALEPSHLRRAVAQELVATAGKYAERGEPSTRNFDRMPDTFELSR